MNIEIANRLYQLRRENGLSQEELAAKLGISRQAVSKWERAEASPDTDNLITLARLYGVSLDELLLHSGAGADEPSADTSAAPEAQNDGPDKSASADAAPSDADTSEASPGDGAPGGEKQGACADGGVRRGPGGINVKDADGSSVHIGWDGIYIIGGEENDADTGCTVTNDPDGTRHITKPGKSVTIDPDGTQHIAKPGKNVTIDPDGTQHIAKPGKNVTIDPDGTVHVVKTNDDNILCAEYKIDADDKLSLPWPVLTLIAFLLIGFFVPGGWYWSWLCFLTIPLYYSVVSAVKRRDPTRFCYPVLTAIVFFAFGIIMGVWHPTWIIFLTIPIYYFLAGLARKAIRKRHPESARFDDDDDDDDDEDDDEDEI